MGKEGNANDNERQGKAKIEMKRKEEKMSSGRDKIKNQNSLTGNEMKCNVKDREEKRREEWGREEKRREEKIVSRTGHERI